MKPFAIVKVLWKSWWIAFALTTVLTICYFIVAPVYDRWNLKHNYFMPVSQRIIEYKAKEGRFPSRQEFRDLVSGFPKYKNGRFLLYSGANQPMLPIRNIEIDFVVSAVWVGGEELYYQSWDGRIYGLEDFD